MAIGHWQLTTSVPAQNPTGAMQIQRRARTVFPNDNRSAAQVAHALVQAGLQPVWKDWDSYLGR